MADPASSTTVTPQGGSTDRPVPEIFDPYLGRAYGNVLDLYDNPTYNIKLSLIRDTVVTDPLKSNTSTTGGTTTSNPRADTPAANASPSATTTSSEPLGRTKPVAPGDLIVIAQTSVTGILIDNLVIQSMTDNALNYTPVRIEFDLIQPGAANLIDQLQVARKWLKVESNNPQFLMSLEVSFMGRTADPDVEDKGGNPILAKVDGPYGWIINIDSIEINVDQTGSKYHFVATPVKNIMYNDRDFRTPVEITCIGSTVKESVDNFQKTLNDYLKKNMPDGYTGPDEYVFDTSRLLGKTKPLLPPNAALRSPSDPDTNPTSIVSSGKVRAETEAADTAADATLVNIGRSEITYPENAWTVPAKTDFYNFFVKLLSVCDDFVNGATNLENPNDPASKSSKRIAVNWVSVEIDVEYIKFDKKRNDYQKKIIVRPVIYETSRPDLQLKLLEADSTDQASRNEENSATFKLQTLRKEGRLLKSYKYLFTGLNDQILNLEMKFDNGAHILQVPRNGMIGDTELITAPMMNPTQPLNKDLSTARGLLGAIDKLRDATKFANVLKSLTDGQIGNIAKSLGIDAVADVETLKNSIRSGTQQAATDLASRLSSRTLNQAANAATAAEAAAAAGGTNITNNDGSPYNPDASGFTYAEDLLTDIMERAGGLTLQQIQDAGLIRASDISSDTFDLRPPVTTDPTVASSGPATSMIAKRGSPSNVLFNYMYAKHSSPNTMLALNMTIRGDPWYLGSARDKSTTNEAALSASNPTYVLLMVATPPPFDLDLNDEDNNTGYWNMNGLSNSFSGVYQLLKVENKFQNGMFTVALTGNKDFLVPLHKIRPLEIGKPSALGGIDLETGAVLTPEDNLTRNPPGTFRAPTVAGGTGSPGGTGSTGGPGGSGATGTNKPTQPMNSLGLAHPLGDQQGVRLSDDYGPRAPPVAGASRIHKGVDLAVARGTNIFAARSGTVERVFFDPGGGYIVDINHGTVDGKPLRTQYMHIDGPGPLVKKGDPVTNQTILGGVGSTGRSTGNHLHYEVIIDGKKENPAPYLGRPRGG